MTKISHTESAKPRFGSKYTRPKFRNYGAGHETRVDLKLHNIG